jgi:hypothetical protein
LFLHIFYVVKHLLLRQVTLGNELNVVALEQVDQKIAQALEVISATGDLEIKLIGGSEYHVGPKHFDFIVTNVDPAFGLITSRKSKVN